ncbi:endo-1-4-beta-xylanase A precursor XylP-Penicillium chrysogenum [Apiospora kogelbergensis]|uniref:Beta-xylanase n=1 Tax=Apiospora kogelbergensis TaxID=1337665 RepID=A0AAW0QE13_9PEZI
MKASTIIYLLATGAAASRCKHRPGSSSAVVPTASASATVSAPVSATATAVPTSDVPATTATSAAPAGSGIDALFKAKGKQYFGTSADQGSLSIKQVAALMKSDFGQVTPENSMKWDAIEPQKGSFSFTGSDALVKYATENNKIVRGHTLLWYQQLPQWVKSITDKAELTQVLQNHIAKVVGRYKGQIKAWDVVNEIFEEDGTIRKDMVFMKVLGEDFVRIAFEAARKADPEAKLYINEYHLESASGTKVTGLNNYVKKWLAAGIPIDGIGLQGHLGGGNPSAAEMQAGMELLSKSGVTELAITELDILNAPADEYTKVFSACLAIDMCVGITTWGVSDANSWLPNDSPLLFDRQYKQKDAYKAVVELLSK